MQLSFSTPPLPLAVRVCRTLVWTEAALSVLGGVFVVLTAALFGEGSAIPFHDSAVSGGGAVALGLVYIAGGVTLAWSGGALGRLAPWARTAIAGLQMSLVVLDLYRSPDLAPSTLLRIALFAAVLALLYAPATGRALAGGRVAA